MKNKAGTDPAVLIAKKQVFVDQLKVNNTVNPLGIDTQVPRFSWVMQSSVRAQAQTAYQILVATSEDRLTEQAADLWNTGKVLSDRSNNISYAGAALTSKTKYYWTVRVWDKNGNPSALGAPAVFETALMSPDEWEADWIQAPDTIALPMFGKSFMLEKDVKSARAYVSGVGLYEMTVNGQTVTDSVLEPGESFFPKTILYATYDLTSRLKKGENAVGVMLGRGFYKVIPGTDRHQHAQADYGDLQLIAQIEVTYADGTKTVVATDETWKTAASPITFLDWFGGVDYDANLEMPGWNRPGYSYSDWESALVSSGPEGTLVAQYYPTTKVMEQWQAVEVLNPEPGVYTIDFGSNFAGVYQFCMSAPQGTSIKLYPSEVLGRNGLIDQTSINYLNGKPVYDTYTFQGQGLETWEPPFLYHGFRYLEIHGLPFAPAPDQFKAKLIRASTQEVSSFHTSSNVINKIHGIIKRSIEANMYNTLTDCPHREKLGWLEVPHLLHNSIVYNFDVSQWMTKISNDILDCQREGGMVPCTAPTFAAGLDGDLPNWAAAMVLIPWQNYLAYGDVQQLQKAYQGMTAWMDYMQKQAPNDLVSYGLGDWCPVDKTTSVEFTESCTYYRVAEAMKQIVLILGQPDDAARYAELETRIKNAIQQKYYHADIQSYDSGSQAANAMALYYGIVEPDQVQGVVGNLARAVERADDHLTAGEIGLKPLFLALGENGRNDLAYAIATAETIPSYWYFIQNGLTSLSEMWDLGSSFNHCMMGHLDGWFYEHLAGIRNDSIAYKHFKVCPYVPGDMEYSTISFQSPYGVIRSAFVKNPDGTTTFTIQVPANTTASILLPTADLGAVTENGVPLDAAVDGVFSVAVKQGMVQIEVGSGVYCLNAPTPTDRLALRQSLRKARQNVSSNVVKGWEELQIAVANGTAVMDDPNASQKDIDAAQAAVDDAARKLILHNYALFKTPISSTLEENPANENPWALKNLVNGDTYDQNGGWSSNDRFAAWQHPEWAGVDFGYPYTIDTVQLYPRSLDQFGNVPSDGFPVDFEIQVSNDGAAWTTVKMVQGAASPSAPYPPVTVHFDPVQVQYVRVFADTLRPCEFDKGSYRMQLAELEVYCTAPDADVQ